MTEERNKSVPFQLEKAASSDCLAVGAAPAIKLAAQTVYKAAKRP